MAITRPASGLKADALGPQLLAAAQRQAQVTAHLQLRAAELYATAKAAGASSASGSQGPPASAQP